MLRILRQFPRNLVKHAQISQSYEHVYNSYNFAPAVTTNFHHNLQICRFKSKKSKKQAQAEISESETGEESTWDDKIADKNTKIMNINVKSTRADLILKSALGIARNKIETLFYESKIRVNGQKLLKKSELAAEGDEIDVIRGVNVNNPNFLNVARVEVLGIKESGENLSVKVRRCKSLTIENYEDSSKGTE